MPTIPKHFPAVAVEDCPNEVCVMKVQIGNVVITAETAENLAKELDDAARFFNHGQSTTVWIEVVSKQLPLFLSKALEGLNGFGMGLVITHAGSCTHGPSKLLPVDLRRSVAKVSRDGQIWQPLAKEMVDSMPSIV